MASPQHELLLCGKALSQKYSKSDDDASLNMFKIGLHHKNTREIIFFSISHNVTEYLDCHC